MHREVIVMGGIFMALVGFSSQIVDDHTQQSPGFFVGRLVVVKRQIFDGLVWHAALAGRAKEQGPQAFAGFRIVCFGQRRRAFGQKCLEVVPVGREVDGGVLGNRVLNFRSGRQHSWVAIGCREFCLGFPA